MISNVRSISRGVMSLTKCVRLYLEKKHMKNHKICISKFERRKIVFTFFLVRRR